MKISIQIGEYTIPASLWDTPTAAAILKALPITSQALVWGDEIYFSLPVQSPLESEAREEVEIGDLAYWPQMPAFCIFFGPTPVSLGTEPRAASPVNVFGKLEKIDLNQLRQISSGTPIKVYRQDDQYRLRE